MKTILLIPRLAMFLKAIEFYGLKEIEGTLNNPKILQFFKDTGHEWVKDDETSWCSAFINWVALKCDCRRSMKLDARSWLGIGREVKYPELGHIVIFWRENKNSWKGHVGLFISQNDTQIFCMGGNQDNQVCIKPYPKKQLLGIIETEYI